MSSGPQRAKAPLPSTSSHDAFASVDSLVSKPVVGSDNTASWQSFQRGTDTSINTSNRSGSSKTIGTGSAPILPVKRADRLGTGLKNREDEIQHEDEVRKEAGDAPVGSGIHRVQKESRSGHSGREKANEARSPTVYVLTKCDTS